MICTTGGRNCTARSTSCGSSGAIAMMRSPHADIIGGSRGASCWIASASAIPRVIATSARIGASLSKIGANWSANILMTGPSASNMTCSAGANASTIFAIRSANSGTIGAIACSNAPKALTSGPSAGSSALMVSTRTFPTSVAMSPSGAISGASACPSVTSRLETTGSTGPRPSAIAEISCPSTGRTGVNEVANSFPSSPRPGPIFSMTSPSVESIPEIAGSAISAACIAPLNSPPSRSPRLFTRSTNPDNAPSRTPLSAACENASPIRSPIYAKLPPISRIRGTAVADRSIMPWVNSPVPPRSPASSSTPPANAALSPRIPSALRRNESACVAIPFSSAATPPIPSLSAGMVTSAVSRS